MHETANKDEVYKDIYMDLSNFLWQSHLLYTWQNWIPVFETVTWIFKKYITAN